MKNTVLPILTFGRNALCKFTEQLLINLQGECWIMLYPFWTIPISVIDALRTMTKHSHEMNDEAEYTAHIRLAFHDGFAPF